ncbi:MAG TPA: hypothetical protein VNS12_10595 [Pelagibacterium sp.]|nr:hypothetical protein [Pelagibacterium sp.]
MAIGSPNWQLMRNDQTSGLGSGQPLSAELASPLWTLPVQLVSMGNDEADHILAMLEMLCHPGRKFYFSNPKREYPAADPSGATLGAATPTLHTIAANNRQLRITGLPNGYRLTVGDMLAFDYGPSGQKRRALHRVTETVSALSSGVTPTFEVFPHIRAGALVGDPVFLAKPAILASVMPGSFNPGTADTVNTHGVAFDIIQRLI